MNFQAYTLRNHPEWACIQAKTPDSELRTPVHLCCVIDTSASMDNNYKLENVKQSLMFLLDFLTPQDMLSVVTFSENAKTIIHKARLDATEKENARTRISLIESESNTNLSAGIVVIRDSLISDTTNMKQGILLLTDGIANLGLTRPENIIELVKNTINTFSGTSISCIGYGTDHNIELLQSITTEGGGSYYVVNNIEDVAVVFGDILGGLLSCVSQQVRVILPNNTEVKTRYAINTINDKMEIVIGDMPAGMEAAFLAKIPNGNPIILKGYNLQTHTVIDINIHVINTNDNTLQLHGEAHYLRFEVLTLIEQSRNLLLRFASHDDIQAILNKIHACISLITEYRRNYDHSLWDILLEELNNCKNTLENRNTIDAADLMTQHAGYLGRMRGIPANMSPSSAEPLISPVPLDRTFSNFAQRNIMSQLHASVTPVAQSRHRNIRNRANSDQDLTQDPQMLLNSPISGRSPLMRALQHLRSPIHMVDPVLQSPDSSLSSNSDS